MAETRCVPPDYALDVDVMVLDYLLHTTIKAHVDDFKNARTPGTAATLTEIFDTFIKLFKHNHGEHQLSQETEFSLRLLEFVVLFTQRRNPKVLPTSTLTHLKESSRRNTVVRMHWWDTARTDSEVAESTTASKITDAWRDYFQPSPTTDDTASPAQDQLRAKAAAQILLVELLPRFLDLSAEMGFNMDQSINEQWMNLAAEFMLQSAWEKHAYLDATPEEEPLKTEFAWGWWPLQARIPVVDGMTREDVLLERTVGMMFGADDDDDEEENSEIVRESPTWSKVRLRYLCSFSIPQDEEREKQHGESDSTSIRKQRQRTQKRQLQRLKEIAEEFPMKVFERRIVDFLEGCWKLERTPLLVQIERGKIDGFTSEEFEEFKANVWPAGSAMI